MNKAFYELTIMDTRVPVFDYCDRNQILFEDKKLQVKTL